MGNDPWRSLDSIVENIKQNSQNHPTRLKTGFQQLDQALGGGLRPGELIVLGGGPSVGKSTFALQLSEYIAQKSGTLVLYFSLEMSSDWIAAKSVCRQNFYDVLQARNPKLALTEEDVQDCATADELISGTKKVQKKDQEQKNQNKFYVVTSVTSASDIAACVEQFRAAFKRSGQKDPMVLVIIDYLQFLQPPQSSGTKPLSDKQMVDESLRLMVGLAHDKGLPVLLISSLNRSGYSSSIQIDAFKETGGIEYSADTLLGLQFCAQRRQKRMDINQEKKKFPRDVEIVILKQRYGASGNAVQFQFYAKFDLFQEAAEPTQSSQAVPKRIYYINNTKLASAIREGATDASITVFDDAETQAKTQTHLKLSEPLNHFECHVADAIYTIYKKSQKFTTREVLTVLSGNDKATANEKSKEKINHIIQKLANLEIEINCEAEMAARGNKNVSVIRGSFLSVKYDPAPKQNIQYHFCAERHPMPLYYYGELTRQFVSFPQILLDVQAAKGNAMKRLSDHDRNIMLKRFLAHRLEVFRENSSTFPKRQISFRPDRDLRLQLDLDPSQFHQKLADIKKTVLDILSYYKRIGYISGFEAKGDFVEIAGAIQNPWYIT